MFQDKPIYRFLAIEPPPALYQLIQQYKDETARLVGNQLYLADPPHLTVYLAAFPEDARLIQRMQRELPKLSAVEVQILGWHVFMADALTTGNTLVCEIAASSKQKLRPFQETIVHCLAPHRLVNETTMRYASRMDRLTATQQDAIRDWGFPFLNQGWEPHFSIASIGVDAWPNVAEALLPKPPSGTYSCVKLKEYILQGIEPQLIDEWVFG
jgi:hypothetical protein